IVASGYGYVAEKIIDLADQGGIPIFRDDTTANMLAMLEIGSNVPPELFQVIAAIYIDIMRMSDEIKQKDFSNTGPAATE
ncbi:MAG: EscU/YscU/HrcU family type III secretion system export apparatus switch protein, partial [Acetanaerobacterium sp.]